MDVNDRVRWTTKALSIYILAITISFIGDFMHQKVWIAVRVLLITPSLLLMGCWESDHELIADDVASDPFDGARYVMYSFDGQDQLLERRPGEYPVFDVFDPGVVNRQVFRFFEISSLLSWFGSERYIAGSQHGYMYLERDEDEWTPFGMRGTALQATSLDEMVAQAEQALRDGKLVRSATIVVAPLDASAAIELKTAMQSRYDRDLQASELAAREEAIRIREQELQEEQLRLDHELQEEQRRREQEQLERITQLEAEVAASREATAAAPPPATDDHEPSEAEMSGGIRNSTLFFGTVTKLGGCRKNAPYDYECRYRWLSTNWGNFWKADGQWYFQIIEDDP